MGNTTEERVKITMDVPKTLRANIRIAAARNDRLVSEEIRDTLTKIYGGATGGIVPSMACSEV